MTYRSVESSLARDRRLVRVIYCFLWICIIIPRGLGDSAKVITFDSRILMSRHATVDKYFDGRIAETLAKNAAEGRLKEIEQCLSEGANINVRGRGGVTPLIWAFMKQNKAGFEYLLQHKADPNLQMEDGRSAVAYAAMHEDIWYLRTVLKYGWNPNLENHVRSFTPICDSISSSNAIDPRLDQVKLLIKSGANLNWQDRNGDTPLMLAVIANQYASAYAMLEGGADPMIKNNSDCTVVTFIKMIRTIPNSETYKWRTKVIAFLDRKGIDVEHGR